MKALSLPLLLALPLTFGAGPSHAGTWYFCDPLRAYYPSVRTCPAPWHPVEAATPGPVPPQARAPSEARAPAARPAAPEAGYQDGLKAREDWWSWHLGLSGSYRDGANYWLLHRKKPQPGTCDEPVGVTDIDPTWTQGCEDAKARLEPIDAKIKSERGFNRGWSSFKPSPEDIQAARKANAEQPQDAGTDPAPAEPAQGDQSQQQPAPDAAPAPAAPPAGSPPPPGVPPAQNGY